MPSSPPFERILIANRGEIAIRIIETCKKLGIQTVAVYSEADCDAPHVSLADVRVPIGAAPVQESYLNQERILEAALQTGASAIHPGYGFLSENASFVRSVENAGLVFIGPQPETIELMGNKERARLFAQEANIPIVPGSEKPIENEEDAVLFAETFGFPILVKAATGGGGIGMQVAKNPKQLRKAIATCKRRSLSAFGNDAIYLERYLEHPRHIEVQILADHYHTVCHLFERECSIQRRHQKVIEEAPSPSLSSSPNLRKSLIQSALTLAKRANYRNAGTVEFIMTPNGDFYFIEMNTRLQVEHRVTEAITGIDLVQEQIQIASGLPISFNQEEVHPTGHAIECRIYAENPKKGFLPSPGKITTYRQPSPQDVLIDSSIIGPTVITPYYDPMLSKLISHGDARENARLQLTNALRHYTIDGISTNISLHIDILESNDFINNQCSTTWLEEFTIQGM